MHVPTFIKSAANPLDFPNDTGREVAFVGRSNSGKSTAINTILGIRKLARVSKTPGRTQLVNFFQIAPERRVVDLPGYGFARVPPRVRDRWRGLLEAYFRERRSLAGLMITVDIRRGLTELDETMLSWVASLEIPVALLLSKADKLSRSAGLAQLQTIAQQVDTAVRLVRFSAIDRTGVPEARAWLDGWLEPSAPPSPVID
ncbi:MAG TPA: ribosome biogenesis GTP-binding protein YihA/YsxC [Gammaproteobacteria bacterium]|nr:ribosome biogenesis GTP-binding protein YihA/YsxC [Gammaproteobacteria bacterium]